MSFAIASHLLQTEEYYLAILLFFISDYVSLFFYFCANYYIMQNWFTCKVKYQKIDSNGKMSRAAETYLVDAINFTEAEKRIFELMEQYISGEMEVIGITRSNYTEIFHYDSGQYWFKAKVSWSVFDEKSSKETKVNNQMLVSADSVREAYDRISENLETMLGPVEISSVALSPILDVFPLFNSNDSADQESV